MSLRQRVLVLDREEIREDKPYQFRGDRDPSVPKSRRDALRKYYIKNLEVRRAKARVRARQWHAEHKLEANAKRKQRYFQEMATPEGREKRRKIVIASEFRAKQRRDMSAPRPRPNCCEACGDFGNKDGIVWDHNHGSGKFRGWLCSRCNLAIGYAKDDPVRLERMAKYLRDFDGKI